MKNTKEPIILFLGDILFFSLALWLTLLIRYVEVPSNFTILSHAVPFGVIFITWVMAFFIAGLYEKHTLLLKSRLPNIILKTQITNSILAVLFFYFIPYYAIAP